MTDMAKSTDASKSTVLIIDDNTTNLGVIADYLKDCGFKTPVASSGEVGLKRTKYVRPDIILLDIMMPGMDGFETCRRLKADEETKDIPVIFMTALADTEHKVRGFTEGAVDYITKPVQQEEVLARVTTHLNLRKLQIQLQEQNEELRQQTDELAQANEEITRLNTVLESENLRMKAELDVARRLQKMVLPTDDELKDIKGLDIACFMEPADEIGGDYYDILRHNGSLKIGIGDVTGHGLESGVVMLMVQTAVRTLMISGETDPRRFLEILNRTVYDNVRRTDMDRILSLALLDYKNGTLKVSGYHESVIVVRENGEVKLLETEGIWIALEPDIAPYLPESQSSIFLQPGDGVVLYSDGITEAFPEGSEPAAENLYELERLCEVVSRNWKKTAEEIKTAVIEDVKAHIGGPSVHDDITLVVIKRK